MRSFKNKLRKYWIGGISTFCYPTWLYLTGFRQLFSSFEKPGKRSKGVQVQKDTPDLMSLFLVQAAKKKEKRGNAPGSNAQRLSNKKDAPSLDTLATVATSRRHNQAQYVHSIVSCYRWLLINAQAEDFDKIVRNRRLPLIASKRPTHVTIQSSHNARSY